MSDKERVVVALGFFDSVHNGHKKVIESAVRRAKELNAKSVVITFEDDVKSKLFSTQENSVFNLSERIERIKKLGVDDIYALPTSTTILSLHKEEFLKLINSEYDILEYVCGEDYTFGYEAEGNAEYLKDYAKNNGQTVSVIAIERYEGEKISTSKIKTLLRIGEIEKVNQMLSEDYAVVGEVYMGRKMGRKLGFPTANINIDDETDLLRNAVYSGYTYVNGKKHKCIINYGYVPSFDIDLVRLEAHILDFNGDLYGKQLKIYFTNFMREIQKFGSEDELRAQLTLDLQKVQND